MGASEQRLVVVVTGANSGVGLGICERLILQLSGGLSSSLAISQTYAKHLEKESSSVPLTLVLACRNPERAEGARRRLLRLLEIDIRQRKDVILRGTGVSFRENLRIETAVLDLASAKGVLEFCDSIQSRFTYVTHLFLNAGTGNFLGVDWWILFLQALDGPINAITYPRFKMQRAGVLSRDGFGLVWQSNVFGHYMIVRLLTPLLSRNPYADSRIIWTTSLEADMGNYASDDWQLIRCDEPYEASKVQQEIMSVELDRSFARNEATRHIRSLVFEPGVVSTSIYAAQLGWILVQCMNLAFYLARILNANTHVVSAVKGATAGIHLALVSESLLPSAGDPTKYGSRASRWGTERADALYISRWKELEEEAATLTARCDRLFTALLGSLSEAKEEKTTGVVP